MVFECRYLHFQKNAVSWYVSFYIHIRFVPKFSNASFCGLYYLQGIKNNVRFVYIETHVIFYVHVIRHVKTL